MDDVKNNDSAHACFSDKKTETTLTMQLKPHSLFQTSKQPTLQVSHTKSDSAKCNLARHDLAKHDFAKRNFAAVCSLKISYL